MKQMSGKGSLGAMEIREEGLGVLSLQGLKRKIAHRRPMECDSRLIWLFSFQKGFVLLYFL